MPSPPPSQLETKRRFTCAHTPLHCSPALLFLSADCSRMVDFTVPQLCKPAGGMATLDAPHCTVFTDTHSHTNTSVSRGHTVLHEHSSSSSKIPPSSAYRRFLAFGHGSGGCVWVLAPFSSSLRLPSTSPCNCQQKRRTKTFFRNEDTSLPYAKYRGHEMLLWVSVLLFSTVPP